MQVNYHRWGSQQRRGYWERWTCVSSVSNFVAVHRKVLSLEFGLENEQESWCSNRAWDPIWGKFRTSYWCWIANHCKNVDVWVDIDNWKLVLSSQCLIYNCFLATEHIWDQIWGKKIGGVPIVAQWIKNPTQPLWECKCDPWPHSVGWIWYCHKV